MIRYWMSWTQPGDDYRPVTWPLPPSIPAYWCSGYTIEGATLCAVVDAKRAEQAQSMIRKAWAWKKGHRVPWRFVEQKPSDWRPGDRFPWPVCP